MTSEEKMMLTELYTWMQERKVQQLVGPVDDTSIAVLGVPSYSGAGTTTKTQSINISSTPASITVPAAYTGTLLVSIEGVIYEIPYIA